MHLKIKIDTFLWSVYSSIVNTLVYGREHVAAYVEYKNTQNTRAHRSTHTNQIPDYSHTSHESGCQN